MTFDELKQSLHFFSMVLIPFSLIPLHVAAFVFAIPESLRVLLDGDLKLSLSINFIVLAVLFGFLARQVPVALLGTLSFLISLNIDRKYYQKGYRRVHVSFTGIGQNSKKFGSIDEIQKHLSDTTIFGRNEARLANLKKAVIQETLRLEAFSRSYNEITVLISVTLFCIYYVGFVRSGIVVLICLLYYFASLFLRLNVGEFRFSLRESVWRKMAEIESDKGVDINELVRLLSVLAVTAVLSGYLRVGYLSANKSLVSVSSEDKYLAIVAKTRNGAIAYDGEAQSYKFLPWGTIDYVGQNR